MESAIAFIDGLNVSVPEVTDRTSLYRLGQFNYNFGRDGTTWIIQGMYLLKLKSVVEKSIAIAPSATTMLFCSYFPTKVAKGLASGHLSSAPNLVGICVLGFVLD